MTNQKRLTVLFAALLTTGSISLSAEEILVAWDSWPDPARETSSDKADIIAEKLSASVSLTGEWLRGAKGSNDETFGTIAGAKPSTSAATGYLATKAAEGDNSIEFTLTNERDTPVKIGAIHFDLQRQWSNAPRYYKVESTGSGISTGLVAKGQLLPFKNPLDTDYEDINAAIALEDSTLAPGETAVFKLTISGGKGTAPMFIDNVAITN